MANQGPLVWVDCEMTGLNHKSDKIIEICCLITDHKLDLVDPEGFERVVRVPEEKLKGMDEWCTRTHTESGLYDKVLKSTTSARETENDLLAYLQKYAPKGKGILAGNSVHIDRLFLLEEFPKVVEYLHYRILDVSSMKEIGYRHNPQLLASMPKKKLAHTARSDILESIEELRWYRNNYLVGPQNDNDKAV